MATITTINNGDAGSVARAAINSSLTNLNNQANTNTSNISTLTSDLNTAESDIATLQTDLGTAESNITTLQAKEFKRLATKTVTEINSELRDGFYTVSSSLVAVNSANVIEVSDAGTISNDKCTILNGKTVAAGDLLISLNVSGSQIWYLINNQTGSGGVSWGAITGTLSSQTDLQSALDSKIGDADYSTAHSILVQQSGTGSPTLVTLSDNELLGKNGSAIVGYSATDIRTLINVEDGADVTDATNVASAGALMTSNNLSDVASAATARDNISAQKKAARQTLTDGATVNWDASSGNIAILTLGGNRTIAAPTNLYDDTYILILKQDVTGGRTVTWNAIFKWSEGTAPTLSTDANAVDIISFVYDGTYLYGSTLTNFS